MEPNRKAEYYLEHYGVKGMRWGVVHDNKKASSNPHRQKNVTKNMITSYGRSNTAKKTTKPSNPSLVKTRKADLQRKLKDYEYYNANAKRGEGQRSAYGFKNKTHSYSDGKITSSMAKDGTLFAHYDPAPGSGKKAWDCILTGPNMTLPDGTPCYEIYKAAESQKNTVLSEYNNTVAALEAINQKEKQEKTKATANDIAKASQNALKKTLSKNAMKSVSSITSSSASKTGSNVISNLLKSVGQKVSSAISSITSAIKGKKK